MPYMQSPVTTGVVVVVVLPCAVPVLCETKVCPPPTSTIEPYVSSAFFSAQPSRSAAVAGFAGCDPPTSGLM